MNLFKHLLLDAKWFDIFLKQTFLVWLWWLVQWLVWWYSQKVDTQHHLTLITKPFNSQHPWWVPSRHTSNLWKSPLPLFQKQIVWHIWPFQWASLSLVCRTCKVYNQWCIFSKVIKVCEVNLISFLSWTSIVAS